MYMLENKKINYDINYKFKNLFVRISQIFIDNKYKYKYKLNKYKTEI